MKSGFNLVHVFVAIACLLPSSVASAPDQTNSLQFDANPPVRPIELLGNAWWIFARGVIDQEAPQRLEQLIADNNIPNGSIIFLDSPGGNVLAAMQLGRIIRQHHFVTYVGVKGEAEDFGPSMGKLYHSKPGSCLSACSLVFLGGTFRYLNNSVYGVHRFYGPSDGGLNSDDAQVVSAAVLQYIRDMGVDEGLFSEMTEAGRTEMKVLSESRLETLGVVNNGEGKTSWTIETAGDYGLYLKGYRDTVWGEQKLIFMCATRNGRLLAEAIFDPKGNADKITAMSAISFLIDGKTFVIPANRIVMNPTLNHGWINVMVALDDQFVQHMMKAKTIGLAVQFTSQAPMFYGIADMSFSEGAKRLPGFMTSCH